MKFTKSVAVAALALAVLGACSKEKSDTPGAAASAGPSAGIAPGEAKAALLAAALKTTATTYKVTMTIASGSTSLGSIQGAADGQNKRMQLSMAMQGQSMDARLIGTDMYIHGLPLMPAKWVHMDMSKVPGGADLFGATGQAFALLNGVTDVTVNPDGTLSGKADPSAALAQAPDSQKASLEKLVKAAKGQPVPFTVTLKDGYLTDYTTTVPVEQSGVSVNTQLTMHLSDFGQPVTVDVPDKADVIELADVTKS
jgi:hypothetical protein